jgi:hypothetical protein
MTCLVVIELHPIGEWIWSLGHTRSLLAAILLLATIIFSVFLQLDRDLTLLYARSADENYQPVIDYVRELPGKVISPQDPTIAYRAKGYVGHSLFFELDKHAVNGNWPAALPHPIEEELAGANFVVQADSYVPTRMFERGLESQQFHPIPIAGLTGSRYTIWTKQPN